MSILTNKPTDRMDGILRHRGFKPAGVRRERVLYKKGPVCYAVETRSVPLYKEATDDGLLQRIREYCKRYSAPSDLPPVVVGSHLACHLLGLGRSNQRSARLHLAGRPVAEVMEALDLLPDAENAAALALVTDSLADSIHRGCVSVDGVPVADALQCYLDVRPSHARGYEQAEFIYERVLRSAMTTLPKNGPSS
jgi:hypothetical protein